MKTIHDFNNSWLRKIWEATCGRIGYPDPTKKNEKGQSIYHRQYECAASYNIRERVSEDTKYDKAAELGLSNIQILPIKSKHERTAILQYFTVNFTDLKNGGETVTVSLQYGGAASIADVDIARQAFTNQKFLFLKTNIEVVEDANFCMYLDLCRQAIDSPIYLPEQIQKSLGFKLELVDRAVKESSRVIRAIGFDKKTDAPKAVPNNNRREIDAYITTQPATRLRVVAKAVGIDITNMLDIAIRESLYEMATDPKNHAKLAEAIGDDRETIMTAIKFLERDALLEFKADNQWWLRDHKDSAEFVLLSGTMMADLAEDKEVAKQRLCSLIMGINTSDAPRRDILREFRRVMDKAERKVTDRAERRNPMDSDAQAAVRDMLIEAQTDGWIRFYPKGAKWCFTDSPNSNDSIIITMTNALPDQKPFDVLLEFALAKPTGWFEGKLEKVKAAAQVA